MPLPSVEVPLRGSGRNQSVWKLEWTYSDGTGTPALDTAQSNQDPRVVTPVADGGVGITNITFPKCTRMWILGKNFVPASATTGSQYLTHEVTDQAPTSGTAKVRYMDLDGTPTATDPASGSRYQLILLLEYT